MVDNTQLTDLINKDRVLKFRFRGCYARDTFPALQKNGFSIVNTHTSTQPGEHWLLIASKNDTVFLYDSLGRDFREYFADIFAKVGRSVRPRNQSIFQYKPSSTLLQPADSQFCGIYCIYLAHFYYRTKQSLTSEKLIQISSFPSYAKEEDVLRFLVHLSR